MPTPLGHSLAGWATAEAWGLQPTRRRWSSLLIVAFVANLADIDYLPGLMMGYPSAVHQQYSHSFVVAVGVGIVLGLLGWRWHGRFTPYFLLFTSVYASHVLLDYLSRDTSEPLGLAMVWPLSSTVFKSPWPIFRDVLKSRSSASFLPSLFVWYNLVSILWEAVLLVPTVVLARSLRRGFFGSAAVWRHRRCP